jgi:prophage tail gpP-like protein
MIVLKVNNKRYSKWNSIKIDTSLNTIASTFELVVEANEQTDELFSAARYIPCEIWNINEEKNINELLIRGKIINHGRSVQKQPKLSTITGYTLTGILATANYPTELYPLQFSNVSLNTIAKRITDHFGLKLFINEGAIDKVNEIYEEEIECKPEESCYAFLKRIADLKGVTVAHDNEGRLVLYRILNVTEASSRIKEGDNYITMEHIPDIQKIHSDCTAIKDVDLLEDGLGTEHKGKDVNQVRVYSPFLVNEKHPLVKVMPDAENRTLKEYAEQQLAEEARNLVITVKRPDFDFAGRIARAGFYIEIESDKLLKENTKFLIERMTLTKEANQPEVMEFTCLLPCVYTKKLPSKNPFK